MANFLTLAHFYFKFWLKTEKLLLGVVQLHLTIFLFNLVFPEYSFLIIPLIFTFLIQLFYSDWESRNDFYSIHNIRSIERHYVKTILLNVITLTFLIHFHLKISGVFVFQQVIDQISYFILIFSLFHFIRSKLLSIIAFVLIYIVSGLIDKYILTDPLIKGIFIVVLIIGNISVYYTELKKIK